MKMKISDNDYDKLKKFLDHGIEQIGIKKLLEHKNKHLGKDINKRFRWDIFRLSNIKIGDGKGIQGDINLYSYMNDEHIDTALKHYVSNNDLL